MRRYFLAGRRAFHGVNKFSQVVDASLFAIDSACGALRGIGQEDSRMTVAWAPPQELGK